MSSSVSRGASNLQSTTGSNEAVGRKQASKSSTKGNYKGFVAGVFSGIAKLSVGHPFDTVKVRLQTSQRSQFSGPIECVAQTFRNEGISGFYKGATPPLLGWMVMDSVMLGSLTLYRGFLQRNVFSNPTIRSWTPGAEAFPSDGSLPRLPSVGHATAGTLAGWTVSMVAAPVEHVKSRLQIQYAADKKDRLYKGPIDCTRKILRAHGITGLYHGLVATTFFRSFFFFWWGSYDIITRHLSNSTSLSAPAINFWAGGLSAQVFWITAYPSDIVKQRIMTDPLGGTLDDGERKFRRWSEAARTVYRENGWRGYWRGFMPCFLRAFPANAMALVAFEGVMRVMD